MKNQIHRHQYAVVIVIMGIILVLCILNTWNKTEDKVESQSTVIKSIPNEYEELFVKKNSIFSKIKTHIINKDNRYPVSSFLYDDKYFITVTRLKTLNDINALPSVKLEFEETEQNYYGSFDGFDIPGGEFNYKPQPLIASECFLTLYGDSVRQILHTDHLVEYYFRMKKYSLKYIKDGPVDLYLETGDPQVFTPTILVLLNNKKRLFLIHIIGHNPVDKLDPEIIDQIVN